jgi:outer membrane protein
MLKSAGMDRQGGSIGRRTPHSQEVGASDAGRRVRRVHAAAFKARAGGEGILNWLRCFAAAALVCAASLTQAQAVEVKIGFVNMDRLLREAAPAIRALKKLEKEFAPRDQELQKMAKQGKDLQTQLEKEGVTMAESDRRNKEADLARINRDLQRMQREFREDLNLRRNEETSQLLERANRVIQQIGEGEKYDLILTDAVAAFRSPRIDITDKVLKALADK